MTRGLQAEHDVVRHAPHVATSGRACFIGADIVVGPACAPQSVPQQDRLRERIWKTLDLTPDGSRSVSRPTRAGSDAARLAVIFVQ